MKLYNIVVCGELLPNFTPEQVQENLIRFLKIPDNFAPKFLLKNRINFKKEVSIEESRKYLLALEKCGLQGYLEETQSQNIDAPSLTTKIPLKSKEQKLMTNPSGASLDSLGLMSDEESQILSEATLTAQVPVKSKGQSIEVSGSTLDSLGLISDEESQILSEATLTAQVPVKSRGQSIAVSGSTLDSLGLISDEESQILSEATLTAQVPVKSRGQSIAVSSSDSASNLGLMIDKEMLPLDETSLNVDVSQFNKYSAIPDQQSPTLSELSLMLDGQDEAQKKTSTASLQTVLAPIELSLITHESADKISDQQTPIVEKKAPQNRQQFDYQSSLLNNKDSYDYEDENAEDEFAVTPSFFGLKKDGRYGRLNFVNAHAIFYGFFLAYLVFMSFMPVSAFFLGTPFLAYIAYYKFRIIALRIQDIGQSGSLAGFVILIDVLAKRYDNWALLGLSLLVTFALLGIPGSKGSNDYGPPCVQGKKWGIIGFIAGLALVLVMTFVDTPVDDYDDAFDEDSEYSLEYETDEEE